MRKRIRREYKWSSGNWVLSEEVHYICDDDLVIQERTSNNLPQVTYSRGRDLSGTDNGAGGSGGLLARSCGYSGANPAVHNYYFADGNGNVTYVLNSAQSMVASYCYDPFGNTISFSGSLANENLYRFSSKEINTNNNLYYYGYRFYNPSLQRWLNRDPITEIGLSRLAATFSLTARPTSSPSGGIRFPLGPRTVSPWGGAATKPSDNWKSSGNALLPYRFCQNDSLNRIDIDGRMDVPPLVIQWYLWQSAIGLLTAGLDWYEVQRQCLKLAEEPDKEAFGQTALSRLLSLINITAISVQCPQGGAIYRHIWYDEKCNCKKNFVVICNGGGGA